MKFIKEFFKKIFNLESNKIIAINFYNKDNILDVKYLSKIEYEVYKIIKETDKKIQAVSINRAMKIYISLASTYKILEDLVAMGLIEVEVIKLIDDPYINIKKYFIRNKIKG